MLKHLYIDNYKCLVNFECDFDQIQLVLGGNGTGKSSIFEVLSSIRSFLNDGLPANQAFPVRTLTRWQSRPIQTFQLDLEHNHSQYRYRLEIEHDLDKKQSRISKEELTYDNNHLFNFDKEEVHLFNDDFKAEAQFFSNGTRSGMENVPERRDNKRLTWFKNWITKLYCLEIDPFRMTGRSETEVLYPDGRLSNFTSWYRNLSQDKQGNLVILFESLKDVIEGFDSLRLVQFGESVRMLHMKQRVSNNPKGIDFAFDELSNGQRVLIALYTVLHFAMEDGATICIDEPDNFVTLREIQPWLRAFRDESIETGTQVFLISHHPELINYLAPECGLQFERTSGGPARITKFSGDHEGILAPAELIARGWE